MMNMSPMRCVAGWTGRLQVRPVALKTGQNTATWESLPPVTNEIAEKNESVRK
jgi:hypothetical protein